MNRTIGSRFLLQSLVLFLLFSIPTILCQDEEESGEEYEDRTIVTCGSVVKLKHAPTGFRLHSHKISYGGGSGQQSVTGFPQNDDTNSYWMVKGAYGRYCPSGTGLKDGDIVRLKHLNTELYLHSHLHKSPLTAQQEVSCYAGRDGEGDTGDNWKLAIPAGGPWKRGETVRFQHVDTSKWLSSNTKKYPSPIPGQQEICAIPSASPDTEWVTEEGLYFPASRKE